MPPKPNRMPAVQQTAAASATLGRMCHLCIRPPVRLTRRQFLGGMAAATAAGFLAACTPTATNPPVPAGRLAGYTHPSAALDMRVPTLAGRLAATTADTLTLTAPVGRKIIHLTPQTTFYDAGAETTKQLPAVVGHTLLVWLDDTAEQPTATAVQQIPPITATDDLPTGLDDSLPAGETRPFGPLTLLSRDAWQAADVQWVPDGESGPYNQQTNPNGLMSYPIPLADHLHSAVLHHSALEFHHGPRTIQRLHQTTAKFADIGYHFLVDGFGQLYEGRPVDVRGAHTGGHNTGYVGICLLGNFERVSPTQTQLDTTAALLAYLHREYDVRQMGGHRDYQPGITVCPGQNFHPLLAGLAHTAGLSVYD